MEESREQSQRRYEAIVEEIRELYERSRLATHPSAVAYWEARISYIECEIAAILR